MSPTSHTGMRSICVTINAHYFVRISGISRIKTEVEMKKTYKVQIAGLRMDLKQWRPRFTWCLFQAEYPILDHG